MESTSEKPIIFAVITLFLTFVVVYVGFFRGQDSPSVQSSDSMYHANVSGSSSDTLVVEHSNTGGILSGNVSLTHTGDQDGWVSLSQTQDGGSGGSLISNSGSTSIEKPNPSSIPEGDKGDQVQNFKKELASLSGVSFWYNSIKMSEILALDAKLAFTDTGGVLYGYLGTGSITASNEIIKRLGGNSVEIETENNIIKNLLRGDRVIFVNIPGVTFVRKGTTEQKLLVAMVIEIGEDKRLIQSPFDRYYTSKKRMKTIFESLYKQTF